MATATLLERNPEVSFRSPTDIDAVVKAAIDFYKKVSCRCYPLVFNVRFYCERGMEHSFKIKSEANIF